MLWINGCNLQCVQEVVDKYRNLTASLVNNLVFPGMLRNGYRFKALEERGGALICIGSVQ